ncbi:MAG: DUF3987 domain-containing protein, partial [Thermosynechococcaceae cyanobacterium]
LKMLTQPLTAMQAEAYREYQERKAQYEQDLCEWEEQKKGDRGKKPIEPKGMRRFAFSNFTQESIGHALQPYPQHGALVSADELAGMIKGMGQFKKSGGNDRQEWLSLYDGHKLDISRRTSDPIFIEKTCIPVMGGIQHVVLYDVMGKIEHVDGFWTRFFYSKMRNSRMPCIDWRDDYDTGLEQTLSSTYRMLNTYPAIEYSLAPNSRKIWQEWHEFTEDERFKHDHPAKRALFRKARARAARIALVAHCFNAAVSGEATPSALISAETLQGAVDYTKWGLHQILSIYSDFGVTDSPQMTRLAKFVERFKESGWVKTSAVTRWWSPKPKPTAEQTRNFMEQVVASGYAIDNGQPGKDYQIKILHHIDGANGTKPPEPLTNKDSTESCVVQNVVRVHHGSGAKVESEDHDTIHPPIVQNDDFQVLHHIDGARAPHFAPHRKSLEHTQDKGLGNSCTICTTDLENKNPEPDDSKLNTAVNRSNRERNGDNIREFLSTPSEGPKHESIKIGDRVRLLLAIETVVSNRNLDGEVFYLKGGHQGVVQKITSGGFLVLFDGLNKPAPVMSADVERCDDDQGDKPIESAPTPSNPRDAISISDGRIDVDLERLDLNHDPPIQPPQWKPTTTLKPYEHLSKIFIDIETTGLDPIQNRIIMIGVMDEKGEKTILTDPDEKAILRKLFDLLRKNKPECLIGHNLVGFDIPFIMARSKRLGITHPFRLGRKARVITSSSVNGRPIEFTPVYWYNVDILDTFQQIAIWDKQAAKLTSYGLKSSVIALGLRDERRLELSNDEIQQSWKSGDISNLSQYLTDDLEDTALLADFLLPVVYYQMAYVPGLTFQELAIASPALKAQKIHESLLPDHTPVADEPLKYKGGKVELLAPGLHNNVAKIDVSSLYPSIMLRYGVCSRKDSEHRFLGVMAYMTQERLKLKEQAKQGNKSASFQEKALKILINGSYGFLGTGGYPFNDYEAAARVTAYGRKILTLMMDVVSSCDATVIEVDTDGIFFSHSEPQAVYELVQDALPSGINIELELENCGLYAPKAKSYVIVHPNGQTSVKGLFRKRDRYPLERDFPVEFLRLYFTDSPESANRYYNTIRDSIASRTIPVEQLTVTRKIGSAEKNLIALGFGKVGDRVSYWYTEQQRFHKKSGKALKSVRLETHTEPYWVQYYLQQIDSIYQDITGNASGDSLMLEESVRLAELPLFKSRDDSAA